ncbi:hypothetical protein [Cohnella fermenti]|uniref:Uncharacterized protein n=1 Tax=Cohnella fermenti TaxID=2565925 RepID=A0A4S4CAL7_9BACL|nr:hypothetical protein [Cohnella fermenti]THF84473.1 hypothetical protein E6C55_00365 [Cohnella fermenti]
MYAKVDYPKGEPTKEWEERAFAPLRDYLRKSRPDEAARILPYLMFMHNEEGQFVYKNCISRASIIFDQSGDLVTLDNEALRYEFEELRGTPVERPPVSERFIHPNVEKWIASRLTREEDSKYGEDVRTFLQELWGPIANYDFSDLRAEYPLSPQGEQPPYCLFVYPSEFEKRVGYLFVGDEIVECRCTRKQFQEYRDAEQDLMIGGWKVIPLYREAFDAELPYCVHRFIELAEWRTPNRPKRQSARRRA